MSTKGREDPGFSILRTILKEQNKAKARIEMALAGERGFKENSLKEKDMNSQ